MGWKNRYQGTRPGTRRWDKLLEQRGLLKYQTENLSDAELQKRYAKYGMTPDYDSLGRQPGEGGAEQVTPSTDYWSQVTVPGPSTTTATPMYRGNALGVNVPAVKAPAATAMPTPVKVQLDKNTTAWTNLPYAPTYWQHPSNVIQWHTAIQAGQPVPEGIDPQAIEMAYEWMKFRNGDQDTHLWKYLNPDDPGLKALADIPEPPKNLVPPGAQYQLGMGMSVADIQHQQALALEQGKVPIWQAPDFQWQALTIDQKKAVLAMPGFSVANVPPVQQGLIVGDPVFDLEGKIARGELPWWQGLAYHALSNPVSAPLVQAGLLGLGGAMTGPAGWVAAGKGALMAVPQSLGAALEQTGDPTLQTFGQYISTFGSLPIQLVMKPLEWGEQAAGISWNYLPKFADVFKQMAADPTHAPDIVANFFTKEKIAPEGMVKGILAAEGQSFWSGSLALTQATQSSNPTIKAAAQWLQDGGDFNKLTDDEKRWFALWQAGKVWYMSDFAGKADLLTQAQDAMQKAGLMKDTSPEYLAMVQREKDAINAILPIFKPENTVWMIGQNKPVPVLPNYTLLDARDRILAGESPDEVMADYTRAYGLSGAFTTQLGYMVNDPLGTLRQAAPQVRAGLHMKAAERIEAGPRPLNIDQVARATLERMHATVELQKGGLVGEMYPGSQASKAFRDLFRTQFMRPEGVTQGDLVRAMTAHERAIAGLLPGGDIKDWQPTKPGIWNFLHNLTPESKAIGSSYQAAENMGVLLDWVPSDERVAQRLYEAVSHASSGDAKALHEQGLAFLDNPEFYTMKGGLKDFMPILEKRATEFETTRPNREVLQLVLGILDEADGRKYIEEFAKGNPGIDFDRINEAAKAKVKVNPKDEQAVRWLKAVEKGLTSDTLAKALQVFKENKELASPVLFKHLILSEFYQHMGKWSVDRFQVKQAGALEETLRGLRGAQAMMLLDFNPQYLINNFLNNRVLMGAEGVFGFTPDRVRNEFFDKFAVTPARYGQGFGPTGEIPAAGLSTAEQVIANRRRGQGAMTSFADAVSAIRRKVGLGSIVSSHIEASSSKQMFYDTMRSWYGKNWKAGMGFERMPPALEMALKENGVDPEVVYRNIEGFLSQDQLRNLTIRASSRTVHQYINDAAATVGMRPEEVSDLLARVGVLDELTQKVAQAKTAEDVKRAIDSVEQKAQDAITIRTAQAVRSTAEHLANKVKAEGFGGAHQLLTDINLELEKRWLDHYASAGELVEFTSQLTDRNLRNNAWRAWRDQEQAFWDMYYAHEGAAWRGLVEGLGVDQPGKLKFLGELAKYMDINRNLVGEQNKAYEAFFAKEFQDPAAARAAFQQLEQGFDRRWRAAENTKAKIWKGIDQQVVQIYVKSFGPEILPQVTKWVMEKQRVHAYMGKIKEQFRNSLTGKSGAERAAAKRTFWQVVYPKLIADFIAQNQVNETNLHRQQPYLPTAEDAARTARLAPALKPEAAEEVKPPSSGAQALDALFNEHPELYKTEAPKPAAPAPEQPAAPEPTKQAPAAEPSPLAGFTAEQVAALNSMGYNNADIQAKPEARDQYRKLANERITEEHTIAAIEKRHPTPPDAPTWNLNGTEYGHVESPQPDWKGLEFRLGQTRMADLKKVAAALGDILTPEAQKGEFSSNDVRIMEFAQKLAKETPEVIRAKTEQAIAADRAAWTERKAKADQAAAQGAEIEARAVAKGGAYAADEALRQSQHEAARKLGAAEGIGESLALYVGQQRRLIELGYSPEQIGKMTQVQMDVLDGYTNFDALDEIRKDIAETIGPPANAQPAAQPAPAPAPAAAAEAPQPPPAPEGPVDIVRRVARENGLPLMDEAGNFNAGNAVHTLNVVRKFGGAEGKAITNVGDIYLHPDVVARAFELRRLEMERQYKMDQMLRPPADEHRRPGFDLLRDVWNKLSPDEQFAAVQKVMVDPVSGLESLHALNLDIEQGMGKPAGWSDFMVDLNGLGGVNDHWGHAAGDQFIGAVGQALREEVAKVTGRAFRIGGDEITGWLPPDQAETVLKAVDERIRNAVITIEVDGVQHQMKGLTVSYGTGTDRASADTALYADKARRLELGERAAKGQLPGSIGEAATRAPGTAGEHPAPAEPSRFDELTDLVIHQGLKSERLRDLAPDLTRHLQDMQREVQQGRQQTLLEAIRDMGGISTEYATDITGEKNPKYPGLFRKRTAGFKGTNAGLGLDQVARNLVDLGFLTEADLTNPGDNDARNKLTDMIRTALAGERIPKVGSEQALELPQWYQDLHTGKNKQAFVDRAINLMLTNQDNVSYGMEPSATDRAIKTEVMRRIGEVAAVDGKYSDLTGLPFDFDGWHDDVMNEALQLDAPHTLDELQFLRMKFDELESRLPGHTSAPDDLAMDYVNASSRLNTMLDDMQARDQIEQQSAKAETDMRTLENRGDMLMTRESFRQQLVEVAGRTPEEADALVAIADAHARAWANERGSTPEEWYKTHLRGIESGGTPQMFQSESANQLKENLMGARVQYRREGKVYRADWVEAAIKEFGLTDNLQEAGYVLSDGRMLDFSGRKHGNTWGGQRIEDHREINRVLHNTSSGTDAMIDFASLTGSIRVSHYFNELTIDIYNGVPSRRALEVLQAAVDRGEVSANIVVDFSTRQGLTVMSLRPSRYEFSVELIQDAAKRIYEGNETPAQIAKRFSNMLYQDRIQPVHRVLTGQEMDNYARALVRAGFDELRRAVTNEENPAQRRRLLDAAHHYDPQLATRVAETLRGMLFQDVQPIWYSKLQRTLEGIQQPTMTVDQLRGMIGKAGVKQDELYWTGFDEWLAGQGGKVSKQDALNYLQQRGVQLEEQLFSEPTAQEVVALREAKQTEQEAWTAYGRYADKARKAIRTEMRILNDADVQDMLNRMPYWPESDWTPEMKGANEFAQAALGPGWLQEMLGLYTDYERASDQRAAISEATNRREPLYRSYTMPGADNYRELLLTLPMRVLVKPLTFEEFYARNYPKQEDLAPVFRDRWMNEAKAAWDRLAPEDRYSLGLGYKSPHWTDQNVLAHTRISDHIDTEGKRVLFVEEVQSDWHQQGREKGYVNEAAESAYARAKLQANVLKNQYDIVLNRFAGDPPGEFVIENSNGYVLGRFKDGKIDWIYGNQPAAVIPELHKWWDAHQAATLQYPDYQAGKGIPQAPFSKTWPELVMKRVLRYAAENGYDRVAWTTGQMQADRYSLARHADAIDYNTGDKLVQLTALNKDREVIWQQGVPRERLAEYVGQDAAKIMTEKGAGRLEGADLAVGGEGMRAFYDQMLPSLMDKYAKKWGAKTGETTIEFGDLHGLSPSEWTLMREYRAMAGAGQDLTAKQQREMDHLEARWANYTGDAVHSLDVNDAMRKSVMEGQPLFQEHQGGVTFLEDQRAIIHAFKASDVSTMAHELGHIFRRDLNGSDLALTEEWAGVKNGVWQRQHEEKFARGFERYLAEGKAPTPELMPVFERFKNWLLTIYQAIRGSAIDVELSPEMRGVFDRLLGGTGEQPAPVAVERIRPPQAVPTTEAIGRFEGGKLYSKTGREVPLPPKIGKGRAGLKNVDGWLVQAAQDEALAKGDNWFSDTMLRSVRNDLLRRGLTQSDRDLLNDYVFGKTEISLREPIPATGKGVIEKGGHLVADPNDPEGARAFVAKLRAAADQAEAEAKATTPSKAERLMQNARAARHDADRIEQSIPAAPAAEVSAPIKNGDRWRKAMALSAHYANGLKNGPKREYAQAYVDWYDAAKPVGQMPADHPGLSAMAAQAVRMSIDEYFKGQEYPFAVPSSEAEMAARMAEIDALQKAEPFNWQAAGLKAEVPGMGVQVAGEQLVGPTAYEDLGAVGGFLPGMQESSGMLFDVQPGTGRKTRMEALNARFATDMVPGKTAIDKKGRTISPGDLVKNIDGNNYIIEGVNARGDLVTDKGALIAARNVERIGKQSDMFSPRSNELPAEPGPEDVNPQTLFQDGGTRPLYPVGGYDQASGYLDMSSVLRDGWVDAVSPVLSAMKAAADTPVREYSFQGFDDKLQAQLNDYLTRVRSDMATTKHAAVRWGETNRDFALLNYQRQYGADKVFNPFIPFQFFASHSGVNWIARVLDNPGWLTTLAKLNRLHNTYQNQLPDRMRNKFYIPIPFIPKELGGGMWIDPTLQLLPFRQFTQPLESFAQNMQSQENSAEYVLRQWVKDGTISPEAAQTAINTRQGDDWRRALEQVKLDSTGEGSSGFDYFSMLFSPAIYLTLPYYLATGKTAGAFGWPNSQLPFTRAAQGLQTAFQGTSLEWLGNAAGMMAKPEQWARGKVGVSEFGQWGNYYIDRQLSLLAIEGKYSTQDVRMAMIERAGPAYDEAERRVRTELMYKMPGIAPLAGIAKGATLDQIIGSILPSLFPGGLLPPAELEAKGLKNEYNLAWKAYTAGDKKALTRFFDEHPEYEARLALRDSAPEDRINRLDQFLKSQVWDGYNRLDKTNRKQAVAYLGPQFDDFLSSDPGTQFSTDQLARWARMLNMMVPNVPETQAATQAVPKPMPIYSKAATDITNEFFATRSAKFPNYYSLENMYYGLPKSERTAFLKRFPQLKMYWDWKDGWLQQHPEMAPIVKGTVFKRVDTTGWPQELVQVVKGAALSGNKVGPGATAMLQRIWISQGRPYGSLSAWLTGQVYPSMMNEMMQNMP